jgi:hypothetical protein
LDKTYQGEIMSRFIIFILFVLFINNITMTVDAQIQSIPSTSALIEKIGDGREDSENGSVNILGIDPTTFPKIKINIFIDKFCAIAGNLKKENFKVKENDKDTAIDKFYFTGNASGQKLDLAIIFDDTGSMGEEISAMKSKVKGLTDTFKASGIDANYSLVSFEDNVSIRTNWTDDPEAFKKQINSLKAQGGVDEPEVSLDAIEAVLSMGFRSDAQKVILVITDAHAHYKNDGSGFSKYTKEEVEKDLKEVGVIFITTTPTFEKPTNYVDLRDIANDIKGMRIDINSADFSTILEQFKRMLTGTYVVEYTSPDQTPAANRTVLVSVNEPECVKGNDMSSYIAPGSTTSSNNPPIIDDLTSVLTSPQDVGTIITWTANASDQDGDPILYRFFLDDEPVTDWITEKTWIWTPNDAGLYRVEVRVRDAKHAGPNGLDDRKSESFTIAEPKPKSTEPENQPPIIDDLLAAQSKTKEITWATNATDSDGDRILYRYFLNDKSMTDWIDRNKWILNATEANAGENRVEVQIRDGNHAGPEGYDDSKSVQFKLSSMKLMAQTWEKTFVGPNYDEGYSVQQTNDGGYIITGKAAFNFSGDLVLIKADAVGNIFWETFGGPKDDVGYSVEQTSDGGYIIAGETQSYGSGGKDVWLIKTDSMGNKAWDRTFGGSDDDVGKSVHQTNDEGYIIAGSTNYNNKKNKGAYIWLIKTDSKGNKVWDRTFGESASAWAESAQQTSDGGYIITGVTQSHDSTMDLNVCLIKTDSQGKMEWDRTFGGSDDDWGKSVQQTSDNGYIISGMTFSYGSGGSDAWLIKTDSLGNEEWNKTFGGSDSDWGYSAQQTSDGGYIITGLHFERDNGALLIKTDPLGNVEWDQTRMSESFVNLWGNSVRQTSDGGYIVAGTAGNSNQDIWLLKTDAYGNV